MLVSSVRVLCRLEVNPCLTHRLENYPSSAHYHSQIMNFVKILFDMIVTGTIPCVIHEACRLDTYGFLLGEYIALSLKVFVGVIYITLFCFQEYLLG